MDYYMQQHSHEFTYSPPVVPTETYDPSQARDVLDSSVHEQLLPTAPAQEKEGKRYRYFLCFYC